MHTITPPDKSPKIRKKDGAANNTLTQSAGYQSWNDNPRNKYTTEENTLNTESPKGSKPTEIP